MRQASAEGLLRPSGVDVKTVLLVVADATRWSALGDALRLESHSVLVAESAEEAVAVVGSAVRPPDLIVTDRRLDAGAGRNLVSLLAVRQPGASVLFLTELSGVGGELPAYFLERTSSPESVARVASRILARP